MKYLLSIAVIALSCISAHAQLFPVQVNTQLVPPFTPYLSDFTAPGSQKLMVQFTIIDPAFSEYNCKLRLTIEGVNITIRTKPTYVPRPITIQGGGIPQLFYGEDLAEYFNPDALDFSGLTRSQYEKGAKLPEGVYRISIEVLDLRRNTVVSNKGTGMAWIILNDPPLLNLPRNNAKVTIVDPANIAFSWTPRHTGSPNAAFTTEYKFRVVEIWPINRNPYDAFLSQPTLYETTTELSQIVYSIGEPALLPGRKYAWQVQAVDTEGRDLFKNQGKSEVFVFQYGDALSIPEGLYLQSATPAALNVRWEIPSMGSVPTGYGLQYRPHNNRKHDNWYKATTIESWKTIDNLEPDTQYEVRLRSEQGATYSDYSSPQVFTTSNISSGEFSCRSDIGNPIVPGGNIPAPKINIGDVIHAAGFDVIVRSLVSNTGGSYTGEGGAIVPLFNLATVHVTFKDINVNEKLWLTSGEIVTFYNPLSPFILNVKKPDKQPEPVEETDDISADSVTVPLSYSIEGIIDSVWVNSNGEIIVVDTDGKETKYVQPASGESRKTVQLTDSGGNSFVVDSDGKVSQVTSKNDAVASSVTGEIKYPYVQSLMTLNYFEEKLYVFTSTPLPSEVSEKVIKILVKDKFKFAGLDLNSVLINPTQDQTEYDPNLRPRYFVPYKIKATDSLLFTSAQAIKWRINNSEIQPNEKKNLNFLREYESKFVDGANIIELDATVSQQAFGAAKQEKIQAAFRFESPDLAKYKVKVTRKGKVYSYKSGEFVGDDDIKKGEINLSKGEKIILEFFEIIDGQDKTIENAIWKVGEKEEVKSKFELVIDTINQIQVLKTKNSKATFRLGLKVSDDQDALPQNQLGNVDYSALSAADTAKAKSKYATALKAVQTYSSNLYNYCASSKVSIQVHLLPSGDARLTKTINGQSKRLDGYADRSETKVISNYNLLDIKNIVYEANTTPQVIRNAVLVKKISTLEKARLINAAKEKVINDQSEILIRKIREISPAVADSLINRILVKGNLSAATLDTLYTNVKESEVSEFLRIGQSTMNVYFNYGTLKSSRLDFSKKIAHELTHVYYGVTRQLDVLKWSVISDKKGIYAYEVADDNNASGGLFNNTCSAGTGHERHNPENSTVCTAEDPIR